MAKKFCFILFIGYCFFFSYFSCFAQEDDLRYGLVNVGIGGVIGGVGAVINKEPGQEFGKVLLTGLVQGALGGYLVFESKRLVREFSQEQNYNYIWPSKILNAAGTSIIENSAANRAFWEKWHLNIGFNRIEVDVRHDFKLRYRIMPFSLFNTIYLFTKAELDLDRSMVFGTFVFSAKEPTLLDGMDADGAAYGNAILLRRGAVMGYKIEAHELIHVYQYESFSGLNMFLNKPMEKLESKNKFLRLYNRIFYTDFNAAIMTGLYGLDKEIHGYSGSSFEQEARYFGAH